jgi:Fe2+ or Zn2+ uptake regulation protein
MNKIKPRKAVRSKAHALEVVKRLRSELAVAENYLATFGGKTLVEVFEKEEERRRLAKEGDHAKLFHSALRGFVEDAVVSCSHRHFTFNDVLSLVRPYVGQFRDLSSVQRILEGMEHEGVLEKVEPSTEGFCLWRHVKKESEARANKRRLAKERNKKADICIYLEGVVLQILGDVRKGRPLSSGQIFSRIEQNRNYGHPDSAEVYDAIDRLVRRGEVKRTSNWEYHLVKAKKSPEDKQASHRALRLSA